jgi:hypothetical protein
MIFFQKQNKQNIITEQTKTHKSRPLQPAPLLLLLLSLLLLLLVVLLAVVAA